MKTKQLCCLALLPLLLIGCTPSQEPETIESVQETLPAVETALDENETEPVQEDPDVAYATELAQKLRENMPRTDGSTSATPMDVSVRAAIFDISYEEAAGQVSHTTSYSSFSNLVNGDCDFVYNLLLSDSQLSYASHLDVAVEQTRIAREGFVFLVSRDNPVDSLTVEEIKGIYSGEITNWSQVGGEDMPIAAYQRNRDSGSQNFMEEFMGDTPLVDAPSVLRPGMMGSLVDSVAAYDGETGGIGYSVYSYVHGMYDADGRVKLLQVDGVTPTETTIADGSYPCTGYNYAIIRADEAEDSPARNLLSYLLTTAGQRAIASTGYYAPLEPDSGIVVESSLVGIELYPDGGTGKAEMERSSVYVRQWVETEPIADYPYDEQVPKDGIRTYWFQNISAPLTGSTELDTDIKQFVCASVEKCMDMELSEDLRWSDTAVIPISTEYTLVNGYLSVVVNRSDAVTAAAMWDVASEKRLMLSDLFTEGSPFMEQLRHLVNRHLDSLDEFSEPVYESLRPFHGVEANFAAFAITETNCVLGTNNYEFMDNKKLHLNLYFSPGENSYFAESETICCSIRELNNCLLSECRETALSTLTDTCHGSFAKDDDVQRKDADAEKNNETWENEGYTVQYRWCDITGYPGAEAINAAQYRYLMKQYDPWSIAWSTESIAEVGRTRAEYYSQAGITDPTREDLQICAIKLYANAFYLGDRYVAITYCSNRSYGDWIGYSGIIHYDHVALYDLNTGEEVPLSTLWKNGSYTGKWALENEPCAAPAETLTPVALLGANFLTPGLYMLFNSEDGEYMLYVDDSCINWDEIGG